MVKLIDIVGKVISGEWGIEDSTGNGIPVLRTTNFTNNGTLNYSNVVKRDIKKNIAEKILRNGDIIIEKSGGTDKAPVGRVVYFQGENNKYLFNNFTGLLRVREPQTWYPKYVFYSLFYNYSIGGTKAFENKTTGIHNLKTDLYIKSTEIKHCNIKLQIEYANRLDKLEALISAAKLELAKLDELVKAKFVEMFGDFNENPKGWNFIELGSLCDVRDGTHDSPKFLPDGYFLLTSKNFTGGTVDFEGAKKISKNDFDDINKRSKVDVCDVVLPMIGTIGHPVIVLTTKEFAIKNVALIKCHGDMSLSIFIKEILDSEYFTRFVAENNRGNTQKFVSLGEIRTLPVACVCKELQNQFADYVGKVESIKSNVRRQLENLETLKKSLMQEYFG